jgi:hypothetical protein
MLRCKTEYLLASQDPRQDQVVVSKNRCWKRRKSKRRNENRQKKIEIGSRRWSGQGRSTGVLIKPGPNRRLNRQGNSAARMNGRARQNDSGGNAWNGKKESLAGAVRKIEALAAAVKSQAKSQSRPPRSTAAHETKRRMGT